MSGDLTIVDAEVEGRRCDVTVHAGLITSVVPYGRGAASGDAIGEVVDARGGALLPGLHDHHVHVLALAAARDSVKVGPDDVGDLDGLAAALRAAHAALPIGTWIRAVGYHESVAPGLDRHALDTIVRDRPVRVQHRSGRQWICNTSALERIGAETIGHAGVGRAPDGSLDGRLTGMDDLLRDRWRAAGDERSLDLGSVAREWAGYGVTGLTDATPVSSADDVAPLVDGVSLGAIPQRLVLTGAPSASRALTAATAGTGIGLGPAKLIVGDHDLPDPDALADLVRDARRANRTVAVHAVTRIGLVLALGALEVVGVFPGDRIEHAGVADPEAIARMAAMGLTVVTQPAFVAERGDRYLAEVDPVDVTHLYPCGSLLEAGVRVGGSTDAPFAHPDPWRTIAAAVTRATRNGVLLGPHERIAASSALRMFLTSADDPGGRARRVEPGAPADLCLLRVSLSVALRSPDAAHVRSTWVGGRVAHVTD